MWVPVVHLALVSLAGSLRPPRPRPTAPGTAFCVLVPAHDEEGHIGATVASILAMSYPEHLRRVVVVADNCKDRTAERAGAAGAEVWERTDPSRRNKGAALSWALDRLLAQDGWDAVACFDADTLPDPDFLSTVAARLATGAMVVQGERSVANANESLVSRLAAVSIAAQCVLRPRGRARLGGAAKLFGNGMAVHRRVLERCPWRVDGLAEDGEYWLALVLDGIHPVHEPYAVVSDLMPADLRSARVQRTRWEAGRSALAHQHLVAGARLALRRKDPVLAEAVFSELLLPNLSVTGAMIAAAATARWAADGRGAGAAALQSTVVVAHLVLALRAAQAPPATYGALLLAPGVALWRLWVTVEAHMKGKDLQWQRTPRPRTDPPANGAGPATSQPAPKRARYRA